MTRIKIRTALVSVSNKDGLDDLGQALADLGVHTLSTGGTYQALSATGVTLEEVAQYTGFPEMMGGRVKTLHPRIHGGLLGRKDLDTEVMEAHGIRPIDLVVVNLYPFEQTVAKPTVRLEEAIENIDIGGPAMLRSAAKNYERVAVVVDPAAYASLIDELRQNDCSLSLATRFDLSVKAFNHVAAYDAAIAKYLNAVAPAGLGS